MAIVNRDLDPSQQSIVVEQTVYGGVAVSASLGLFTPGVATGRTYVIAEVPGPMQLVAAQAAAFGVSGSPAHSLWVYRFSGGFTSLGAIGQTLAVQGYGTSGAQAFSLFAGTSILLQAGDLIALYTQGSNAAVDSVTVSLVLKATQDIKTSFGV